MATDSDAQNDAKPALIIVMGVSGTGKSTLGSALAAALDLPYIDGDDLHPQSNVDKMAAGTPLTDADREPWLELIRTTAEHTAVDQQLQPAPHSQGLVIACSALKRYYRDILRGRIKPTHSPQTLSAHLEPQHVLPAYFVYIKGERDILMDRMQKRTGHFMKAEMLNSQLETLESPEGEDGVVTVLLQESTEEQVDKAKQGLKTLVEGNLSNSS